MNPDELLGSCRVLVELPAADPDDLIAAGELLIQEGMATWTLPHQRRDELAELRQVFGRRVRLGIADLRSPDQVAEAVAVEPDLLLSPFADPDLLAAADGRPIVLGGLTPAEVAAALRLEPAAVLVVPCDALGSLYARTITAMFPGEPLIAAGKLERFQCEMWLEAGALAVSPSGAFGAADLADPDLTELRRRAQSYNFL